jgi:hypothetical protein
VTFDRVTRRLHLYLALALLPWFLMYAASSLVFSHPKLLESRYDPARGWVDWRKRFEQPIAARIAIDAPAAERRAFAKRVLDEHHVACGSFGIHPIGKDVLEIWCGSFLKVTRLRFQTTTGMLTAEDRAFRVDHFLTGMHGRGGFEQESAGNLAWAIVVDLVCLGFLLWAATGILMWWKLRALRRWGALALAAGGVAFTAFMLGL